MPRRYYAFSTYEYLQSADAQNVAISVLALILVAGQLIFLANFIWSLFAGRAADGGEPFDGRLLRPDTDERATPYPVDRHADR